MASQDDDDLSATERDIVYKRLFALLVSPAVTRINFRIGLLSVDPQGWSAVFSAVQNGAADAPGPGIRVDLSQEMQPGARASYNMYTNSYEFPTWSFGMNSIDESMAMVHESVHAMMDIRGLSNGVRYSPETMNEAAGYIAGCLYQIYAGGQPTGIAANIASAIQNSPGATVPAADALALQKAILSFPIYGNDLTLATSMARFADGIEKKSGLAVFPWGGRGY